MFSLFQKTPTWVFLVFATTFEVFGDAVVRKAIYHYAGVARGSLLLAGACLLLAYGFTLNLAPVEFGRVVGLYIATLFIVWQIGNFLAFQTLPTLPIVVGGVLIIAGGLIITYWKPSAA